MSIAGERVFAGEVPVTYVVQNAHAPNRRLVASFAAFSAPGTFRYGYLKRLEDIDAPRLFILDDRGPRGCYYLGENCDFAMRRSVSALVRQILDELGIPAGDAIACGSSKGGSAALLLGLDLGFGNVVAGSPQILIGDFLLRGDADSAIGDPGQRRAVAEYITGGSGDVERAQLNALIPDAARQAPGPTRVDLFISRHDRHHAERVPALLDAAAANPRVAVDVTWDDHPSHKGMGQAFVPFLRGRMAQLVAPT